MRKESLLVLFVLFQVILVIGIPTTSFSYNDKAAAVKSILSQQSKDGGFGSNKNTYFAVATLKYLNSLTEIPNKDRVCETVSDDNLDLENLYYSSFVRDALGCGKTITDTQSQTLENGLKSTKAMDLAYTLASLHYLTQTKRHSIKDESINAGVKKLISLADDEGLIGGKIFTTGASLSALAFYPKVDKDGLNALLTSSLELVSQADGEGYLEFPREGDYSSLRVTATYFSGVTQLANALGKSGALKPEQTAQFAETFLLSKHVSSVEDLYQVVSGLTSAKNAQPSPLVVSLANNILKGAESVKVKVTDVFGNVASKAKVLLTRAVGLEDKKELLKELALTGDEKDFSSYHFDMLSAKPEAGAYNLEFKVTPEGSTAYSTVKSVLRQLRVISGASVSDFQIVVSDSMDPQDLNDGKKYKVEHPKALDTKITAERFQHLTATFKVKNSVSQKSLQPHQVFLSFDNGKEIKYAAAVHDGKQYQATLTLDELPASSSDYALSLTVGDTYISNSFTWNIGTVSVKTSNTTRTSSQQTTENAFAAKPEIQHKFRPAEKRPHKTISWAFTLACLSPFLFLFVGLLRVGANLGNFPMGAGFIWAVGFQACFGAILALFALYWLSLNMMQTLFYLGVLSVPTVIFAQKSLNHLAAQSAKVKIQ